MATEVACGQCHGRLLIETPGVVVACPHCGVHLSIPAPEPESATQPEPILEHDTAVETPPAPDMPPAADDPGDIEWNFGTGEPFAEAPPNEVPVDPLASSSVFGGPDEHDEATEAGWHSAPNLYVAPGDSPPIVGVGMEPSPELFTSPLMDRTPDPSPDSVRGQAMAMFHSFGEAPQTTDPVWNFALGEAEASATDAMFLSSSQQFTLGAPADEMPDVPESMFAVGPSAGTTGFVAPEASPPEAASLPEAASVQTIALPGAATDELSLFSSHQFSLGAAAATVAAVDVGVSGSLDLNETQSDPAVLAAPSVSAPAAVVADSASAAQQKVLVMLLLVVGSYASALTIALLYLLVIGRTHPLESLPDLKPPVELKGEVKFISPKNDLPAGHVLKLGQSQRFGSVRVTPVKVTRGTVKFQPTSEKSALELTDTEPLLKLWLKFENVSQDQTFAPLDELLVFNRQKSSPKSKRGAKGVIAHNFLAAAGNRKLAKSIFRVYDLPTDIGFAMIGQKLNTELPPGETWQTFVPSEEEAVNLKGDLVWRVHIRKGYHPQSRRGVTTLIDVQFNSQDISNES